MRYEIKKDKYSKSREGRDKFYIISCNICKQEIFIYQKDGSGQLLRMYVDRFVAPQSFVDELKNVKNKKEMRVLKCPKCGELLAVPMIYKKENRLAYRVISNKITKKEENAPLEYDL